MKKITLDKQLKEKVPGYCLAIMSFATEVTPTQESLKQEMEQLEKEMMEQLSILNYLTQKIGVKTLFK